jgi:hypothetical protein
MRHAGWRSRARFTPRAGAGLTAALLVALTAPLLSSAPAWAQQGERGVVITPTVGWQWGGTLQFTGGDVHINAATNYGGTIGTEVRPGLFAELGYTYQASKVIGRPNLGPDFHLFDLGTHYYQISGLHFIPRGESKATPYLIGGLGMTIFDPHSSQYGDFGSKTLFSMSLGGGVRVAMNPKVSIRLQSRLLLPINWASGGVYFGTGGSGLSVSGGSSLPQGDASLGISFKLGQ